MDNQNTFKALDQRAREATIAMEQLTAQMAEVQAAAEAIHRESEALRIAAEKEAEAAKRGKWRTTGRVRFHIGRQKGYVVRVYAPGLPGANKKLVYLGCIRRDWFESDDTWEDGTETINSYMEQIFQLGIDYQRDIIAPGLDPGTGRSDRTNTSKKINATSMQMPDQGEQGSTGIVDSSGIDAGPGVDVGPGTSAPRRRRPRDTKDDAIGRLFNELEREDQAVITAFYMPSGVTSEMLMAHYEDNSRSIATMGMRNRLRAYFRKNPDKEFTVEKAKDILQIHKQDKLRAAEVANPGNDWHGQVGTRG